MVLSFLASHGGTSAKAIINAISIGRLQAQIGIVITNNCNSAIFTWCQENHIPVTCLNTAMYTTLQQLDEAIVKTLQEYNTTMIVLSGYMKKIGTATLNAYINKIINVHPSLLPLHSGEGMWGDYVHESVLRSKDRQSGATVHYVSEEYDEGEILGQKSLPIHENETVESLRERIKALENELFIDVLASLISKEKSLCDFYEADQCRSCELMNIAYEEQVRQKEQQLQLLLKPFDVKQYEPSVKSIQKAFRNRAKMVALGFAHEPKLGIINHEKNELSLTQCPLYSSSMQQLLQGIEAWIKQAGLPPYKIERKKGELKYVLVNETQEHTFMVRFVLASNKRLESIKEHLPALLDAYPSIKVVSVNIQPLHMARLEGDEEIFLTQQKRLEERFNGVPLFMQPKSFFQTNSSIASRLYARAQELSSTLHIKTVWDLFCGVGGFGLHCATPNRELTGFEIEPNAIESAKQSAQLLGLEHVHFQALDLSALESNTMHAPDLLIVNPPRRGLGEKLSMQLNTLAPKNIFYSSCNAQTLAKDLALFSNYSVEVVQLFDMFPHTAHYEVLVYLKRV